MRLSNMPTFDQVLDDQLSDHRFRGEWERTRLAREVATELVRYRAEHGLTQAALARRAGVSRSTVARLEAADHEPSPTVLARLAERLGLSFHIDGGGAVRSEVPPGTAGPDPVGPSTPPRCSKPGCEATAVLRMGGLDACGRHTNWVVARQERIMFTFSGTALPEKCTVCGHDFNGHLYVVADDFNSFTRRDGQTVSVPSGGMVVCPEDDCDCKSTWSLDNAGRARASSRRQPPSSTV